jgi:Helix-turn-helix domain
VKRYLVSAEVADQLHWSVRKVQDMSRRGLIPYVRIGGTRPYLHDPDQLDAWLAGAELEIVDLPRGGRLVRAKAS